MIDVNAWVLAFIAGFWSFLQWVFDKRAKKRTEELREIVERLERNDELTVAFSRERINHLCNQFMDLGYIPKNDYVGFKMLGDAYCKHHNSEVQIKFLWCIENLEVE